MNPADRRGHFVKKEEVTQTATRHTPARAGQLRTPLRADAAMAAALGVLAVLVRLALYRRSFDLYGDEVVYTELGRSVISGGFPNYQGSAFFLHGPGYFYLESLWARITGPPPGLLTWVFDVRALNGLLAGATATALALLAARAGSRRTGAVAGLLFALEPFCIRQNDRVLLETAMMFWVLIGYLVLATLIGRDRSLRNWPRAVGAGLLFGCAVLTKDEAALLTVLPLLVAIIVRWGPRRPLAFLSIGTTVAVYAAYALIVAVNGQFSDLWGTKTFGIQRMLGLVQITGFKSQGGGNLSARLIGEAAWFGTTYLILALALPAVVIVLRRGGQLQRMLGLFYCAATVTLAYAVLLGTLEEQELYLLIVPSLLMISVAVSLLAPQRRVGSPDRARSATVRPHALTLTAATLTVLAIGLNIATITQWFASPDDAFVQMYQYVTGHLPQGSKIAALPGDIDSEYALGAKYEVGFWDTPATLKRSGARYIIIEWGSAAEGYSGVSSRQARVLSRGGHVLFTASGRSYGQVTLYQLPAVTSSSPVQG
jgi:4-amino-4-deoxy-L-arabinose transferase-like glycosyltransferase